MVTLASPATSESRPREAFSLGSETGRRGNLFNFFFGPAPPMPTERGLLLIHAFHDRNGNGEKDPGEEMIARGISCTVEDIEYPLPAFIPGLRLNGNFQVDCSGIEFLPKAPESQIFIERRGQIVRLELPCNPAP